MVIIAQRDTIALVETDHPNLPVSKYSCFTIKMHSTKPQACTLSLRQRFIRWKHTKDTQQQDAMWNLMGFYLECYKRNFQ